MSKAELLDSSPVARSGRRCLALDLAARWIHFPLAGPCIRRQFGEAGK